MPPPCPLHPEIATPCLSLSWSTLASPGQLSCPLLLGHLPSLPWSDLRCVPMVPGSKGLGTDVTSALEQGQGPSGTTSVGRGDPLMRGLQWRRERLTLPAPAPKLVQGSAGRGPRVGIRSSAKRAPAVSAGLMTWVGGWVPPWMGGFLPGWVAGRAGSVPRCSGSLLGSVCSEFHACFLSQVLSAPRALQHYE